MDNELKSINKTHYVAEDHKVVAVAVVIIIIVAISYHLICQVEIAMNYCRTVQKKFCISTGYSICASSGHSLALSYIVNLTDTIND